MEKNIGCDEIKVLYYVNVVITIMIFILCIYIALDCHNSLQKVIKKVDQSNKKRSKLAVPGEEANSTETEGVTAPPNSPTDNNGDSASDSVADDQLYLAPNPVLAEQAPLAVAEVNPIPQQAHGQPDEFELRGARPRLPEVPDEHCLVGLYDNEDNPEHHHYENSGQYVKFGLARNTHAKCKK